MLRLPEGIGRNATLDKNNYPFIVDKETDKVLIGRWIGSVEIVTNAFQTEDGWDYGTEYFLAYQLLSGKIVYIDRMPEDIEDDIVEDVIPCKDGEIKVKRNLFDGHGLIRTKVKSLKKEDFEIKWGWYPVNFKEEWQYCAPIYVPVEEGIFEAVETDQLPF